MNTYDTYLYMPIRPQTEQSAGRCVRASTPDA